MPAVIITISSGAVQSVVSDHPEIAGMDAVIVDLDTEGADPNDLETVLFPANQMNNDGLIDAYVDGTVISRNEGESYISLPPIYQDEGERVRVEHTEEVCPECHRAAQYEVMGELLRVLNQITGARIERLLTSLDAIATEAKKK